MLRAVRRVLKPAGRHAFFVITLREGLSAADQERAVDVGREYLPAGPGYPSLIAEAGFVDIEDDDVTPGYLEVLESWVREWTGAASDLIALHGEAEYEDRIARWTSAAELVTEGLLERHLFSANAPPDWADSLD